MTDSPTTSLRMAVCTHSVSHFEAPLFRLAAQQVALQIKVFYIDEIASAKRFDADYQQNIDWGNDLLAGYESMHCANARDMTKQVDSWDADVVMMYGYAWPGAARMILSRWLRRKPQIHRGTMSHELNPRRPVRSLLKRPVVHRLLRLFDSHHYGGDYSREVLRRAGVKPEAVFFVPYSVDSPYFAKQAGAKDAQAEARAIRERFGWSANDQVLLFIAQHSWLKGPDIAMEVFAKLAARNSSTRFLVTGSGIETDAMVRYAAEHLAPGRVAFTGFVPSADTVPFYLTADLVLCTSRYETWARMVNEAMLCRRPCVVNIHVAAAGGLVSDNVNGYVVGSLAVDDFVDTIERHFAKPVAERLCMGEAACNAAMDFSYERNIQHVLDAARYAVARRQR